MVLTKRIIPCLDVTEGRVVKGIKFIQLRDAGNVVELGKFYDEQGKLVRELLFKENKQFGQRVIPSVMELISKQKQGHRTIIRYLEVWFDLALSQDIFTLRNLRSE